MSVLIKKKNAEKNINIKKFNYQKDRNTTKIKSYDNKRKNNTVFNQQSFLFRNDWESFHNSIINLYCVHHPLT